MHESIPNQERFANKNHSVSYLENGKATAFLYLDISLENIYSLKAKKIINHELGNFYRKERK
jgi:uncharacterized protein YjhX (UPF0386 family)